MNPRVCATRRRGLDPNTLFRDIVTRRGVRRVRGAWGVTREQVAPRTCSMLRDAEAECVGAPGPRWEV